MKTLKFLFALLPVMTFAVACDETESDSTDDGAAKLVVTVSKTLIRANGEDPSEITVYYENKAVAFENVLFYNADDDTPLDFASNVYTADEPGTLTFWAAYNTENTKDAPTKIRATDLEIPDSVVDGQPDNTSFVHRSLLIDFTGAWCGYCPYMAVTMRELAADPNYADKVVFSAFHNNDSLAPSDPNLERALSVNGYPTMYIDFRRSVSNTGVISSNVSAITRYVDMYHQEPAKAGIAANVVSEENTVIVYASVKAAETAKLSIGGWLVEDGCTATRTQEDYSRGALTSEYGIDLNIHNHVLRILDSRVSNFNYSGHDLGTVQKGRTADYLFTWELDEAWNKENCSIILFVTTPDEKGKYYLTNVVHLDGLSGELPFDYE